MVKVTVLYGHPNDPDEFEEYYENNHLPIAAQIPNVQRFEAGRIVATPDGSEPPYLPGCGAVVREHGADAEQHGFAREKGGNRG